MTTAMMSDDKDEDDDDDDDQAATIKLPNFPGRSLFGSGNNDLHFTCPTRQSYHSSCTNIQNHILISNKPSTYSDFLTLRILSCYSGMFGQAVLWPSFPNRAIKKRENCCSLMMIQWWSLVSLSLCHHWQQWRGKNNFMFTLKIYK